jgi:predicted pyridoxine 5'-phosphate oxidase superfamily flavin-nucleotide-binding protein
MSNDFPIQNLKQLRTIIPDYPKLMDKRIKNSLDTYSREFLQASNIAIFSCSVMKNIEIIALNTAQLSLHGESILQLKLPRPLAFEVSESASPPGCTLYFLVAGIGHGLRINGELSLLSKDADINTVAFEISIRQLYFHCSRALVRANFWQAHQSIHSLNAESNKPHETLSADSQNFLKHSSLVFICSRNTRGELEMSPRGDEPGFVKHLPGNTLLIPERPGNKVAITLRNILENPTIKLLFLIPKLNQVLQISGRARLSNKPDFLQQLVINNKPPKLAIILEVEHYQLSESLSLVDADIWNRDHYRSQDEFHSFAKIMNTHLHGESLMAKTLQPVVSAVIKHDLKNLY